MKNASKSAQDNRANQLNPNNAAYWTSRGLPGVLASVPPPSPPPQPQPQAQPQQPSSSPRK